MDRLRQSLLGLLLLGLLLGCSTPRVDWNSRVGIYSYDQAVVDFGPPDKYATLQDGTIVAEWLLRRGYAYARGPYAYGYSPWGYGYGPYYSGYVDSYSPDYYLRLTFGPDSRLRAWKNFYK